MVKTKSNAPPTTTGAPKVKKERKPVVRFGLANELKLVGWLQDNQEYLDSRPTFPDSARKASAELGLIITASTLKRVAKEIDCLWEPVKVNKSSLAAQLAAAQARIAELEEQNKEFKNGLNS